MDPNTVVSIIVPLEQDGQALEDLVTEIDQTIGAAYRFFEIILVDDGSTDGTSAAVQPLLEKIQRIRYLRLSRPFGRDVALSAGIAGALVFGLGVAAWQYREKSGALDRAHQVARVPAAGRRGVHDEAAFVERVEVLVGRRRRAAHEPVVAAAQRQEAQKHEQIREGGAPHARIVTAAPARASDKAVSV